MTPRSMVSIEKIASSAPEPPRQWPIIDLVEETATLRAFSSPRASLMARVSAMSPGGVEVPWALM